MPGFRNTSTSSPLTLIAIVASVVALAAGCGDDGSVPVDATMDAGGDGGGDGGGMVDCSSEIDGTSCGGTEICLRGVCTPSRCGDGYVDTIAGEVCDDGNDLPGDGCEPSSCTPSCAEDADCDDGDPCTGTETCNTSLSRCQAGSDGDGMMCTLAMGGDGVCASGLCSPPGCGNGVVDGMEDCDDGMNGDNDDGCRDDCQFTCVDAAGCTDAEPCNGEEVCDVVTHTCSDGAPPDCDDGDPCTADSCATDTGCVNDFIDVDGDMYAPGTCTTAGLMGGDCDDTNFTRFPGAMELCDSIDNDCDGTVDEDTVDITCHRDADGDGYGSETDTVVACTCPAGYISRGMDCNDANSNVNPDHTDYETVSIGRSGGYDWNCSGSEEQRYTSRSSSCRLTCSGPFCFCTGAGWTTSTIPACGTPTGIGFANYQNCNLVTGGCVAQNVRRTQACR